MKRVLAGLIAGAMWACAAAPALAQDATPPLTPEDLSDAQMDEVYCVYDYLGGHGDNDALTRAYMNNDHDSQDYAVRMAVVEDGAKSCKAKYNWSDDMKDLAFMLGMYGKMGDVLDARLKAKGLSDTQIAAVLSAAEALPDGDLGAFVDGTWMKKSDLHQRLKAALVKQGVDGDETLTDAFYRAEAYIVASVLVTDWASKLPRG